MFYQYICPGQKKRGKIKPIINLKPLKRVSKDNTLYHENIKISSQSDSKRGLGDISFDPMMRAYISKYF